VEQTRERSDAETVSVAETDPSSSLIRPQPLRLGRFTILAELGRGGMGIVYAAYDADLDRKVAVKVLRAHDDGPEHASEGRARLLREAQSMARLSHPNVATVHEVGTVGQQVYLAMEFIEGRTLKTWIAEIGGAAGWQAIVDMFVQAGEGLAAAHRAGLIHRDFKPDNVLVDDEGRARVLDFGLARSERSSAGAPSSSATSSGDSHELETDLTRVGQVMGTPAYMAPEQFMGEPLDGRSDQFSFCVALYEALCGERPFHASSFVELRMRVLSGKPPTPPDHVTAPAWLLRVVLRGLGRHPAERYDTMQELLDALGRDPGRRRRRMAWGLAAGVLIAGGAWGSLAYVEHELDRARAPEDPCADADAPLHGIWDVERKRAIRAAFAETKLGYAEHTWERIQSRLDEYTARWAEANGAVCRATEVEHTQSEELQLVRQACLNRRLSELRAQTAIFIRADPQVVESAVAGIDQMKDPDECRGVQTMHIEMPLPVDEAAAARVAELRQQLDDVMALITSGKRDEALVVAQAVVAEAERLAYLPFIAEAQLRLGVTLDKKGRYDEAARALEAALTAAEVGRHDAAAVDAWNEWLRTVGYHQGRLEVARATLPRLDAALRRLGVDALREAAAFKTRGTLAYADGDFEAAVRQFRSGLEIVERELGPDHGQTAILCQNLGTALERVGRYDDAEQVLERGLRIWSSNHGAQHPGLAAIHESLGDVARGRHDTKAAIEHFTLALAVFERTHDAMHPELSLRYRELGQAHDEAQHPEEAIRWYRKALEAERTRLGGPEPPFTTSMALARALVDQHRRSEAMLVLEEVIQHPDAGQSVEAEAMARRLLATTELPRK